MTDLTFNLTTCAELDLDAELGFRGSSKSKATSKGNLCRGNKRVADEGQLGFL